MRPYPVDRVDARSSPTLRAWLQNVYLLYLYELTAFNPGGYRLSPEGRWEPDYLPYWLSPLYCYPLAIRRGETSVGFALVGVGAFPFKSPGCDVRMSEFFVLRPYRRCGVGRAGALAAFGGFHGIREVTELRENILAIAFWRTVIREFTGGQYLDESVGALQRQVFESRGSP
jgi:predicted acetyltransferase